MLLNILNNIISYFKINITKLYNICINIYDTRQIYSKSELINYIQVDPILYTIFNECKCIGWCIDKYDIANRYFVHSCFNNDIYKIKYLHYILQKYNKIINIHFKNDIGFKYAITSDKSNVSFIKYLIEYGEIYNTKIDIKSKLDVCLDKKYRSVIKNDVKNDVKNYLMYQLKRIYYTKQPNNTYNIIILDDITKQYHKYYIKNNTRKYCYQSFK